MAVNIISLRIVMRKREPKDRLPEGCRGGASPPTGWSIRLGYLEAVGAALRRPRATEGRPYDVDRRITTVVCGLRSTT